MSEKGNSGILLPRYLPFCVVIFHIYLFQYIEEKEGYFVDVENGKVIGRQKGHHLYTIGQRARIGGLSEAYYVVDKENNSNKVLLVRGPGYMCYSLLYLNQAKGRDHPALYTHRFTTAVPSWIAGTPPPALLHEGELTCLLRYRHLSPLSKIMYMYTISMCTLITLLHSK